MDPLSVIFGAFFLGLPLGILTDRYLIPWGAHVLAGRLRSHVRIR